MKKIILLIFATTLLLGCKKQQIKNDLIGYWVYTGNNDANGLVLDGIQFLKKGECIALHTDHDYTTILGYGIKGSWSISKDKIILDWGTTEDGTKIVFPLPGEFDLIIIDENHIYIDGYEYVKVQNVSL